MDYSVDVLDVITVVSWILGATGLTSYQYQLADMDANNDVTIFDIIQMVNVILLDRGVPLSGEHKQQLRQVLNTLNRKSVTSTEKQKIRNTLNMLNRR